MDLAAKFLRVPVAVQSLIPQNSAIPSLEHRSQRPKSNVPARISLPVFSSENEFLQLRRSLLSKLFGIWYLRALQVIRGLPNSY